MNQSTNDLLTTIAREHLGLTTLEARRSDDLDFHDLAVWQIRSALEAAYRAGQEAARAHPPASSLAQT